MKITKKRWIHGGACTLLALGLLAGGCGRATPVADTMPTGCAQDDHAAHAGHRHAQAPARVEPVSGSDAHEGHGHAQAPAGAAAASLAERVSAACEHGVPIYQCDACRYEVGVVKVDASLLKKTDGSGLVRTQAVATATLNAFLPTTAEVALNENAAVHISPRIPGIIESAPADIGARVQAGDILLTLASVELGRALADHERNQTLSGLSERILARETRLWEQKVGSEQDMMAAQMAFEQHRADLKMSEQALHVLGLTETDLATLREAPHGPGASRLPLRAPLAGTIVEKHAVAGEWAEPGQNLMLLADLTTVWVWANVHSRDLAPLLAAEKHGPPAVAVTVAAFPGRPFDGTLDYVGATMNEQTRTVKVRATVRNPDLALRPGMFCDVTISLHHGEGEEVLAVPRAAVLTDEGATFVFKHWKDDLYIRHEVRQGRVFGDRVEILDGLRAGDSVVTDGAFLLKSDVLREKMGAGCAD